MTEPAGTPGKRGSWLAAVAAVAATYVYFLIFAEFAFLEVAQESAPGKLRLVMTALGAGGVTGAFLAARLFPPGRRRAQLAWTFRAVAAGAGWSAVASGLPALVGAALAVGASLGALTVTLSVSLRSAMGDGRLGLGIGAGTGLAYAFCNVPMVFQASPRAQTWVAAGVAVAASFLPRVMSDRSFGRVETGDFSRWGIARWVVVLLALVWMDSAAFYVIQHAPDLRSATWGGPGTLAANAVVHFAAALAAGALLDRGRRAWVAGAGAVALALACLGLAGVVPALIPAAWWYTAGVSLYSTVLVDYPARSGRAGVAALVFAVAGWIGSALGIGMAQDLRRIPVAFVAVAGAAVVAALVARARALRAMTVVAAATLASGATGAEPGEAAQVRLGREVYIAEGCQHCHSQYVRPGVARDVEWWGPATDLGAALRETPPLFGNRRQGPDLAEVGNRRSPEWNRLHLADPRAISPGSRMPRYAHLFAPGDGRGEALVAYLATLGRERGAERRAFEARWKPAAGAVAPPEVARVRFAQLCAPCHGGEGRGDGPVAARLSLRPADWTTAPWRHVPAGPESGEILDRIIKFGLPGLPMAGHEYLPDGDIVGLARLVRNLHKGGAATVVAASPP